MKKLVVVAAGNNFNFIQDIADALQDDFEIDLLRYFPVERGSFFGKLSDADVVWLEWADGICLELFFDDFCSRKYLRKKKVILRIHRYELFNRRLIDKIALIDPSIIDNLVFVSNYVRQIGIQYFPWMGKGVVVPNLIDIEKFPFQERLPGFNLLFLGRISYVKNLPLMLNMLNELVGLHSYYKLHLVGDIHEPELVYYLDNYLDKAGLHDNVVIHGYIENEKLPELMKEMNIICSASIFESQGVGILEGMATGLKPAVFNFPGAEQFFPEKYLYINRQQFVDIVMSPVRDNRVYRDFVLHNFSIQEKIGLYKDLINDS